MTTSKSHEVNACPEKSDCMQETETYLTFDELQSLGHV